MVKKRSISHKSESVHINPVDRKTLEGDLSLLDHSLIREPINLGVKNVQQIITCINEGTREVKDLILNECNIIYECRVCHNLFRSLANFLAHKRLYCKKHCCEKMILFESDWFNSKKNFTDQDNNNSMDCESSRNSDLMSEENSNIQLEDGTNVISAIDCNSKDADSNICDHSKIEDNASDDTIGSTGTHIFQKPIEIQKSISERIESFLSENPIDSGQRLMKKKRIEDLLHRVSSGTAGESSQIEESKSHCHEENINPDHFPDDALDDEDISTEKITSPSSDLCNETSLINAQNLVSSNMGNVIEPPETNMVKDEIPVENESNTKFYGQNKTTFYDLTSPKRISSFNDVYRSSHSNELNSSETSDSLITHRRYETRCSIRKKCFYNCNSKSCFFSKHCQNEPSSNDCESGSKESKKKDSTSNRQINDNNSDSVSSSKKVRAVSVKRKKKIKKMKQTIKEIKNIMSENSLEHTNVSSESLPPTNSEGSLSSQISTNSSNDDGKNFDQVLDDPITISDEDSESKESDSIPLVQTNELSFNQSMFDNQTIIRKSIVTSTSHSPLITKLSLKNFNDNSKNYKKSKESKLKIHLRTTGSKCYQIVDT